MRGLEVLLTERPLDPGALHAAFIASADASGAVASFTGIVRGRHAGGVIDYLYLDWYPGMSEASLQAIADATAERFTIDALSVVHRCGQVRAGEPIVFVAAASVHRRAAFEAVDYAMDRLKSEAALWKREVGPGLDRWVEPTEKDVADLERWTGPQVKT